MKKRVKVLMVLFVSYIMLANILSAIAMDFSAEEIYDSVFVVYSNNSLGSGFAIGKNCIVTNAHVITDESIIQIATYSGKKHEAFLLKKDENLDIALIGVNDVEFKPLQTETLSSVKIGDDVYAIGAPNSLSYTLTKGVVSAKDRKVGEQIFIQTDAAINSGNSGGPLLNSGGKVIGVNSYKMTDSEGIGLAITIETVTEFVSNSGVPIDQNGNIEGAVTEPDNKDKKESNTDEMDIKSHNNTDIKDYILYGALCLSVSLNIFLIIVVVFQKRKNLDSKIDPSERTDFDIDILG